jgi:predicted transglutaminase-like cysteine proteinase
LFFFQRLRCQKKVVVEAVDFDRDPGRQRIADWYALMRKKRDVSEMEKLESVNSFINQLKFVEDLSHREKDDSWATPQEMLISNGGDCECFATAKYFTLRQLAVREKKLRLIYVKS